MRATGETVDVCKDKTNNALLHGTPRQISNRFVHLKTQTDRHRRSEPLADSAARLSQLGGDEKALWLMTNERPECAPLDDMEFSINERVRFDLPQRLSHPQWRRLFKELWGRPTTTADFGASFRQIPYTSYVCLLEDKVQDRGIYLFTISYGGDAMDQGSGVG